MSIDNMRRRAAALSKAAGGTDQVDLIQWSDVVQEDEKLSADTATVQGHPPLRRKAKESEEDFFERASAHFKATTTERPLYVWLSHERD